MRRIALIALAAFFIAGCTGTSFKIPKEEFSQKVRTLGVLPLLTDGSSEIIHPDKNRLLTLIKENNRDKTSCLVSRLKKHKNYFDVRYVPGNPDALFNALVREGRLQTDNNGTAKDYEFDTGFLADLSSQNLVDAYLVIILKGVMLPQKRWDRTRLNYLESDYNVVIEQAYVVLPDGRVAWEHKGSAADAFLTLQYPDFDEAHYNKTNKVKVKLVSLEGVERTLQTPSGGLVEKNEKCPEPYRQLFDRISNNLKTGFFSAF